MPVSTFRPRLMGAAFAFLLPVFGIASPVVSAAQEPESWPPSTYGLAFLWENGGESNTIPTEGTVDQLCRLIPRDRGRFTRFWAMDLAGGAFHAEPMMNASVLDTLQESNQLTLELVITPSRNDASRPVHIVSYGETSNSWSFVLAQQQDALLFGVRGLGSGQSQLIDVGQLAQGQPHHVVVTVGDDAARSYIDGRLAFSDDATPVDFSGWTDSQLSFGQAADGSGDWAGSVEGVALYNRTLSGDEAEMHYRAYAGRLKGRGPIAALEVEGRLTTKRDIPRATVYPNSLVVFDYRLTAVSDGTYDEEKILVAHWGNLNGERQMATQDVRVGRAYRLRLEPFDQHPELTALQIVINEEDFHLPLFFAISDPTPLR